MKMGRNDPCHCGSSKKYKKCCLSKDELINPSNIARLRVELEKKMKEQKERLSIHGMLINYVKSISFNGKRVFGIGSRVYYERPENETFEEFLLFILYQTLGVDWIKEQRVKSKNEHFIAKCFNEFDKWRISNSTDQNKVENKKYGAIPNGYVSFLITFAFDLATLIYKENLPDFFLKRLQNKKHFQGARYEVSIAAIFTRLGFDVKFLDTTSHTDSHGEFIATHMSGQKIAVEVKSREREGVLHKRLESTEVDHLKPKLKNITAAALSKNKDDIPFIAFIDVNLPTSSKQVFEQDWFKELRDGLNRMEGQITEEKPAKHTCIVYTNYSYHYDTDDLAKGGSYSLLLPKYTKHPISADLINNLLTALENYGFVPSDYDL